LPDGRNRFDFAILAHLGIDPIGGASEREFAQRDEVPFAEEILDRAFRLSRDIDLAFLEALQEVIGWQVDELHFVGLFQHRIGHRLPHADPADSSHHVVQALQVLDVQRRIDVDASIEQLLDILPALGMARAFHIGMGQLIDQDQRGVTLEGGIEIELLEVGAAIGHCASWQPLQTSSRASVSARPWVSTKPATTSTPCARSSRASPSIA
jgi:hypothetical protein